MEIIELLTLWNNSSADEPTMSLDNQAQYLSKKYKTKECEVDVGVYNEDTEQMDAVKQTKTLVRFKDVICKYRPHLHMGDYWLDVNIVDGQAHYKFYAFIEPEEGVEKMVTAVHPHLSGGIPCLGSFQGDLATNFAESNFVQFFAVMKAYLQAYNCRSTYSRGSNYKKQKLWGYLHSYNEILEMFTSEEGGDIDVYGIAKDPMRWNWPKDLTAHNSVEIQGQDISLLNNWVKEVKYPILKNNHVIHGGEKGYKVIAYVNTAHVVGELPLYQAFEFVRIFLTSLQAQYEGNMDSKTMDELKEMAVAMYISRQERNFKVNSRYISRLDDTHYDEVKSLWSNGLKDYYINPYSSRRENNNSFAEDLNYLGNHLSNFLILLRKKAPHLAKSKTYLKRVKTAPDIVDIRKRYNKVKKHAYNIALTQLEKEKRRFINELNRPEISNIPDSTGQGSLFSENL